MILLKPFLFSLFVILIYTNDRYYLKYSLKAEETVGRFEREECELYSLSLSLYLTLPCFLSPVYLVIKAPHTEGMYRLTALQPLTS